MKFNDDGFVEIESDLNGYTKSEGKSLYDIKGATFPELVFETFSVWHQIYELVDGEFQFRVLSINENNVSLGRISSGDNSELLTLTKASASDYQELGKKQEIDSTLYNYFNNPDKYFKVATSTDYNIQGLVDIDFDSHLFYLSYTDNSGAAQNSTTTYSYSEEGLNFIQPLNINGNEVNRLTISIDSDSIIRLTDNQNKKLEVTSTNLPDFEFQGAVDLFSQYTFYYVGDYSPALDTLDEQIQQAGLFVIPQIYRDYALGTQSYNALTFLIFETSDIYDFHGFNMNSPQKLGEDWIRFQWDGTRDQNIDNELFLILRDYILFFFDKRGFKIIPNRGVFTLVKKDNPEQYIVVVPVS
jgi:hypothetical protein